MKSRVRVIEHKGRTIIYGDYSDVKGDDFIRAIGEQESVSLECREENVLHLMNFTNCTMSTEARRRAEQMIRTLYDSGRTVKSACFGVSGIQRVIVSAVKLDLYFSENIEDAKEWLVAE